MPTNDNASCGCEEFQTWTRRRFLDQSRAAIAAVATAPAWLPKIALSQEFVSNRDVLVVVFLRGAMDGLTAVVPHGDPNLYAPGLRPNIVVPPPGNTNGAVDLDGFFGLAPALAPLHQIYAANQLAVVHATGSPDPTRSHFDAYKQMEYGTPLAPNTLFSGWLARHLQGTAPTGSGLFRGIALSDLLPRTLAEAPATLPIPDPANFAFPGNPLTAIDRRNALEQAYLTSVDPVGTTAQSTVDTLALLESIDIAGYIPSGGAVYDDEYLAYSLRSVAAIVKADVGLETAVVELGGWDTHSQQGVFTGGMANQMAKLSSALVAFWLDMQSRINSLTVVVMSEFGRRADENGSLGTDHGHGNCMFAIGGGIAGGQVLADWTSGELLHPDLLHDGDSLEVTIDYRDILSEILQNRMDNTDLATVFPNYTPTFQGITVA